MTANRQDSEDQDSEVVVLDAQAMPEPVGPPEGMSADEVEQAKRQAHELVRNLRELSGGRELAAIDDITNTGMQAQRNAGRQLELAKTRLGTFLDEGGASKEIATGMVDLRVASNRIDPNLGRRGFLSAHARRTAVPSGSLQPRRAWAAEDRPAVRARLQADHGHRDPVARRADVARGATT